MDKMWRDGSVVGIQGCGNSMNLKHVQGRCGNARGRASTQSWVKLGKFYLDFLLLLLPHTQKVILKVFLSEKRKQTFCMLTKLQRDYLKMQYR